MKRSRLPFFMLITGMCSPVLFAVVDTGQDVVLDFTKANTIKTLAKWTDSEYLNLTAEGLGWDGNANEYRDVTIETVKPTAVGWSWRPLTTLHVEAEVLPAGEFRFGKTSIAWPSTAGTLYARYSPDGRHWSTWQALSLRRPRVRDNPRLWFHGTLRVPKKARHRYVEHLKDFTGTKRPIGVDEEAAVRWILDRESAFFEQNLPFIGYVEFLWEKSIRGDQRLKQLKIHLSYSRGGKERVPQGHDHYDRWRFKAPQEQREPARSANRDHATTVAVSFDELTERDIGKTCVVTGPFIGYGGSGGPAPAGMVTIHPWDRILIRGELFKIEQDSVTVRHPFPGSPGSYKRVWIPRSGIQMIEFVKQ